MKKKTIEKDFLENPFGIIDFKEKRNYVTSVISIIAKNGTLEEGKITLPLKEKISLQLMEGGEVSENIIDSLMYFNGHVYVHSIINKKDGTKKEDNSSLYEFYLSEVKTITRAIENLYTENNDEDELRINPIGSEEIVHVSLDPEKTPIAFRNKVIDLMSAGYSYKEARKIARQPIEMEAYFQVGLGLFLVESEAVESTDIFSPYTAERYKSPLE